ncbi:MAG: phosphatidylglycerol lysyltransferase domain-containing protein, partial [Muribaculaceae bacterium]|nr:phosphatidylglycerol lysyltransferase domain-containing protein [Muribaculaceae bacterium]
MNTAVKTYPAYPSFDTLYEALRNADKMRQARVKNESSDNKQTEIIEFRPVTHASMKEIYPYLLMEQGRTTDFSYAGLLMWVDYFKYSYAIVKDTLFIKGTVENDTRIPAFSLPVGRLPLSESLDMIREYCRKEGITPVLSAVPEYALTQFIDLGISDIQPLDDWGDYLYDATMLSSLSGKKMGKKRNHVNKFDTLYPGSKIEPLTALNADRAIEFMTPVDAEGDSTPMAVEERRMTRHLLDLIKEGDSRLEGAILDVDGETAAFTIGDVKHDTLFVHVEKAGRKFEGSYEKINKEFASLMCKKYPEIKYINREDDSGDEGLRKAKQSYHPVEILKKYNIAI